MPVTITISLTDTVTTVVTSTDTALAPVNRRAQETGLASAEGNDSLLEARDQIVMEGSKPDYATACKTNQDYAVACLCYGVKAGTQRTVTQTKMVTSTVTQTATATTRATVVETSTTIVPPCSSDLQNDASNCGACGVACGTINPRCQAGKCVQDQCREPIFDACARRTCPDGQPQYCGDGSCFATDRGNRCIGDPGECGIQCYGDSAICPTGQVCALTNCCGGEFACFDELSCPAV